MMNTGSRATGSRATGSRATGSRATGSRATGSRATALALTTACCLGIFLAAASAAEGQTHALTVDTDGLTNLGDFTTGYEFTVHSDILLSHLGLYDGDGDGLLSFDVEVGLWDSSHTLIATSTVPAGTVIEDGFFYAKAPCVWLRAGNNYVVGALGDTEPFAYDRQVTMGPELSFVRGLAANGTSLAEPAEIVRGTSDTNASYMGGSFKYMQPPSGVAAASFTGGATNAGGPNYSVGWRFTVANPISVTSLGVVDADGGGLGQTHTVRLYDVTHDTILATTTIPANTAATLTGGYGSHFVDLESPIDLAPGTSYMVVKQNATFDKFLFNTVTTMGGDIQWEVGKAALGALPASVADFTISHFNGSYFGANFLYKSTAGSISVGSYLDRTIYQRNELNFAHVRVTATYSGTPDCVEGRAVTRPGYGGTDTAWIALEGSPNGGGVSDLIAVPAGWYDIEVRSLIDGVELASDSVERVGVGEVFITAGQSNSADYGNPPQSPNDERVTTLNLNTGLWQAADDPQPNTPGTGGSPWPQMGDLLAAAYDVPVGVLAVGIGSTTVEEWQNGGHFERIQMAHYLLEETGYRAILWHQGESDSIQGTPSDSYQLLLETLIAESRTHAGWDIPWGVANASWHPSASAVNEARILAAQQAVINGDPLVFRGSQTNSFHLHDPSYLFDTVHFNTLGLEAHAQQWVDAMACLLSGDFPACNTVFGDDFESGTFSSGWTVVMEP